MAGRGGWQSQGGRGGQAGGPPYPSARPSFQDGWAAGPLGGALAPVPGAASGPAPGGPSLMQPGNAFQGPPGPAFVPARPGFPRPQGPSSGPLPGPMAPGPRPTAPTFASPPQFSKGFSPGQPPVARPQFPGAAPGPPPSLQQGPRPVALPASAPGYSGPPSAPPIGGTHPYPPPGLAAPGPLGQHPGGGFAGTSVPPPQPGPMASLPQPGYGPYPNQVNQALLDKFESMNLGPSAPGANDAITDASTLPRPVGPDAATALEPSTPPMTMCCNSAFICPTVSRFPHTATMRTRFALPLAAVITPLAEGEGVPEVKLISSEHQGTAGIVRCRRCRTYINPFVKWVDGGRRWTCNICLAMNDVPADYFCTLDAATGLRRDVDQRLELSLGSVEYVAPKEYMVRGPMPAVYFFLIDVSTPAVHSGLLETLASTLDSVLDSLPGDSRTRIGFMTFDRTLHFYNLKSSLSQPQMMVVPDVDEPFVPMPDDLLVNLKDSKTVVRALLESLKTQFTERSCAECAMGPALQAAFMVMSHIGGKLLLFLSSPPTLGIGRLRAQRDNAALYGSDREHLLRTPEDKFFKDFAAEASRVQITIDLFVFHPTFIDLASLSALPRYTGGQVYYYPGFHCQRDATKLQAELSWNLKRTTAWEAVMRIRCSKGLRIIGFTGHFFIRSSDLLALPTVDPDKSFAIHLTHEDSVLESQTVYLQCALLYTSSCGQRRIRVHTLAAPATSDLGEVYKSVDAAQVATLLAKLAVEKSYHTRLHEVRTLVQGKLISSLKEYRALHSGHFRGVNKLIYPESFKHIHVWVLGLLKTAAIRGGADDVNADERVAVGLEIVSCTFKQVLRLLYPSLFQLHDLRLDWGQKDADGKIKLPPTVALSKEHLRPDGAYLLDNGRVFVLWLGQALPREYVSSLFGMDPSTSPGDYSSMAVEPPKDNPVSQRVNAVLRRLREGRGVHAHCYVARQGSQTEAHIAPLFVEDRTHNTHGYLDFVHHLHRQIGAKQ